MSTKPCASREPKGSAEETGSYDAGHGFLLAYYAERIT